MRSSNPHIQLLTSQACMHCTSIILIAIALLSLCMFKHYWVAMAITKDLDSIQLLYAEKIK